MCYAPTTSFAVTRARAPPFLLYVRLRFIASVDVIMAHLFHEMGFAVCIAHREEAHRPSCGCPYECDYSQEFAEGELRNILSDASRPFKHFFTTLLGQVA